MWWTELARNADRLERELPDRVIIEASADVAPTAQISGAVTIGARTKICHGAMIAGPVEIGEDCLIGNLAMVRGATSIGNGTRIGFASELKQAIVGQHVSIGPQCFVADSIIENRVYLGAQVRTSNHRLDGHAVSVIVDGTPVETGLEKLGTLIGAGSSLGIQVIVLPGRIIVPDTMIGPRIIVERNLSAGRYRLAQSIEQF